MHAPLIGLSMYGVKENDEENRVSLPVQYLEGVRRAGGIPLLIGPGEPRLKDLMSRLDGLILTGGGDLNPELYGSAGHPSIYMVDPLRDSSEFALMRYSLESQMPTLGICRGAQLLNIFCGGTLVEHVPEVYGRQVLHRSHEGKPVTHALEITPGSRLAEILGATKLEAPSWHHQAIRQLAPNLRVCAVAEDGLIEAIEHTEHPWLLAVQWHPELSAAQDPLQQKLFNAFVQACRAPKPLH